MISDSLEHDVIRDDFVADGDALEGRVVQIPASLEEEIVLAGPGEAHLAVQRGQKDA